MSLVRVNVPLRILSCCLPENVTICYHCSSLWSEETTLPEEIPQLPERNVEMSTDHYIRRRNELYRQAREFLSGILADGPQPYQAILAQATKAGISLSSLLTAKQALRVESRKVNKSTLWYLPPVA
jgi:hypothetical protein